MDASGAASQKSKRDLQLEKALKGAAKRKGSSSLSGPDKRARVLVGTSPKKTVSTGAMPRSTEKTTGGTAAPIVVQRGATQSAKDSSTSSKEKSGDASRVAQTSSAKTTTGEKGKEVKMNFSIPEDFMSNDILDKDVLFPHLANFQLPGYDERYKDSALDDIGCHVTGLSFMAFQAGLSLYSQLGRVKETLLERETEALSARENEKAALDKLKTVVSREKSLEAKVKAVSAEYKKALEDFNKEKAYLRGQVERASTDLKVEKERATEAVDTAEVLKSKVLDLEGKVEELVEEKEQIEAFARLTARAALMRRHLRGDNPMAKAQAEVDSYLSHFGPENLDEDDAIDAEDKSPLEVEVVQKETTADAQVDTPPVVVLPTDPAQAEVEASGADTGEAAAAVVPPA